MSSNQRRPHFWSEEETDFLLQTLKEMNIDRYKDGRKHRNSLVFRKVCAKHREAGFARSCDQVKHRWKTLKSIYYKVKKRNYNNNNGEFKHYDTMEEIFGHRPSVITNQIEVDVDDKDGSPLSDSECFFFEDGECEDDDGVEDSKGGIQEIQSVKIESEPLILTQPSNESSTSTESYTPAQPITFTESINSAQPSTSQQPLVQGLFKPKRPCCVAMHTQYQDFLERMQQAQNTWLEHQLEQSHAREERLISRVLTEHTRSMETLVNQLFAGLKSLLPSQSNSNPQPVFTAPEILHTPPQPHANPAEPTTNISCHPEEHSGGQMSETVKQPSE